MRGTVTHHRERRPKSTIGWLPTLKRTELHLLKFNRAMPYEERRTLRKSKVARIFASPPLHDPKMNLRSSDTVQMDITIEKHTFQDSAAVIFNSPVCTRLKQ